jgi:hypothetical protein
MVALVAVKCIIYMLGCNVLDVTTQCTQIETTTHEDEHGYSFSVSNTNM